MSDWIDKLAASDRAQAESHKTQDELRLHKAKIIAAKAPEFWNAVIERLGVDSTKLRETFPDDRSRQCSLIKNGMDWELSGCKLPWRILSFRLNVDGQLVDIVESRKEALDRTVPKGRDQIRITVNSDEDLEFRYRGTTHVTPDSLAQHPQRSPKTGH
jgi:hypothetical protein